VRRMRRIWWGPTVALLALAGTAGPAAAQVMDQARYLFLYADRFEQAPGYSGQPMRLGAIGWYGADYNRLWLKVDGTADTRGGQGEGEVQALLSRIVAPYWDAQVGVRLDGMWGGENRVRPQLALGLQGLAPYWFDVETALFVSPAGDVSARVQASYELLFTQRLMLEPDFELNAALQDQPDWGVGAGLSNAELGLRVLYEIRREFAPYAGFVWQWSVGRTADFARTAGAPLRQSSLVIGVRTWY